MSVEEIKSLVDCKWAEYFKTIEESGIGKDGALAALAEMAYKQGFMDGSNWGLDKVKERLS